MKMQDTIATQWMRQLPPALARVFAGRPVNEQPAETNEADEVEIPHSRWSWEGSEEASRGKQTGHFTRRPEIMVPVDFSAESEEAVDYAIKVARRAKARLIFLHAVHLNLTPYGPANPTQLRSALCREALQKMEGIMARAHRQGVPTICVIEQGAPSHVIPAATKRWNVDLVVMASRKRGGWVRLFGRRILEKVTRGINCPVMVIHAEAKGTAI